MIRLFELLRACQKALLKVLSDSATVQVVESLGGLVCLQYWHVILTVDFPSSPTLLNLVAVFDYSLCMEQFLQGYQGMVDGGDAIVPAEWKTVSNIIQRVSVHVFFF